MKFGRLIYRYTGCTYVEKGAIFNIGDNIQTFAVDNFYRKMGIPSEDIVDINFADMKYYDGEEVILPMTGYGSHYKRFNQLPASDKIIPLFIGFEMSDPTCDDIVPYLKKHEPIGCRDEATMQLLREKGVLAYVSGCLTITLPRRKTEPVNPKTFFIDVSSKLEKYIPETLKENCEYVKHEGKLDTIPMTEEERINIDKMALGMLERYRDEAGLVVTSRLHAAAPCVALGIPVILAIDNVDRRFSWLDKLIPIYDIEHYGEIDWNPAARDCEWVKERLFEVFQSNIHALKNRNNMKIISKYWENRNKVDYDGRLWKKLEGLRERYNAEDEFSYIIWGAGVHGKLAYTMLKEHFPNARMLICVDKYVEGSFFDGRICKPQEVSGYSFDYALITSHPGRFEAVQELNKMGKKWRKDYCYFISKDIPEEEWGGVKPEDNIILYGFNAYCVEQIEHLSGKGYTVAGIIDQNPKNRGEYKGIPIICSINELNISEKVCAFIMLQNGMQHWDIACNLYKQGIDRVVFLPMKTGFFNKEIQEDFIIQYNYMMEGKYAAMRVPYLCDEMFEPGNGKKWYVARKLAGDEKILWVSTDLIRTTLKETERYRNIPIAEFAPYINLFSYLSGEKTNISEYISLYGKSPFPESSKESFNFVHNKRIGLYEFFEDKFYSGNLDYFVAAAPKAVWNKKGYLNLCEGQHRCVYLLTKGMKKVPVRLEKADIDCLDSEVLA